MINDSSSGKAHAGYAGSMEYAMDSAMESAERPAEEPVEKPGRLLLCTDLDRTLLPNGQQPESPKARELFCRLADLENVTLAYVTGRDERLVREAIEYYRLPWPDWLLADVGSSLYRLNTAYVAESRSAKSAKSAKSGRSGRSGKSGMTGGEALLSLEQGWSLYLSEDWQGRQSEQLKALLEKELSERPFKSWFKRMRLQEPENQGTHKLSYFLESAPVSVIDKDTASPDEICGALSDLLLKHGIRSNCIFSVDETQLDQQGQPLGLLDILPGRADKYLGIRYLMEHCGYSEAEVVFCGDSGNDLAVLTSEIPAVLVANAEPSVRQLACRQAEERGNRQRLYLAEGDIHGINGLNGNYSAGIIEGVLHFHPEFDKLIGMMSLSL